MSYQHFTQDERNQISILLKKGHSRRDIGGVLGKDHSSVSREIKNNSVRGIYDPRKAGAKAKAKRSKSKYQGMKVVRNSDLQKRIAKNLKDDHWTPEEIAGRWNGENHLDAEGKKVIISTPAIYKYLYSAYGQSLCKYLISRRYGVKRRPKGGKPKRQLIPRRISIEERPLAVNDRTEFGHFEGDTLGRIKIDTGVIAGLSERMSRYILIRKMPGLKYAMDGFNEMLNPYHSLVKSLTLDNGVENVKWEKLGIDTYFCHPYSSWEKGGMENLFKRLRRFIPKKASLKDYSEEDIIRFADIMNNTPRKCLNWKTPKEVFEEQCALAKLKINSNIYSPTVALDYLM